MAVAEWTSRELLERMIAGQKLAWHTFDARYRSLILSAIRRVTVRFPAASRAHVEEDVYAAFVASLFRRDMRKLRAFEFERGHKLETWVAMLATHAAWDYLRVLARRAPTVDDSVCEGIACPGANPLEQLIAQEEWRRAHRAIASLSHKDRRMIELTFMDGRSANETAGELGISVTTVYTKTHKIRRRLEKLLRGSPATRSRAVPCSAERSVRARSHGGPQRAFGSSE